MSASSGTPSDALTSSTPVAPEIAAVAAPGTPYREVPVTAGGSVRGRVSVVGDIPRDTAVQTTRDQAVCGMQVVDEPIAVSNGRLSGAVVWLAGVRTGKPLPIERRYELLNDHCRLLPRVQATLVGGTVNVRSADPMVVHDNRFVRQSGARPLLARTHTNDDGQVVPVEQILTTPGLVEAHCDSHPWSRGWLFAFDHPYFATTARDGSFAIDSVPPGRYTLVVWHERGDIVTTAVTIGAGEMVTADMEWRAGSR